MSNHKAKDILSWDLFYNTSRKLKSSPKKVELYNRLICHTKNFFAIAGYGAFTKGYVIILTKELLPSFALIKDDQKDELDWFYNLIKSSVKNIYQKKIISFEHGMCACVGGLDRAHCHIMSVDKKTSNKTIINSINKVLENRRAGIKSIDFRGTKVENLYDINQIILKTKKKDYKIDGYQFKLKDIQNLDSIKWPFIAQKHVMRGGHYVYFNTENKNSSFLTTLNFQTQMGREITYEIELLSNKTLKKYRDKIKSKNQFSNLWRWQEFLFEENILDTMHRFRKHFKSFEVNKFNFKFL